MKGIIQKYFSTKRLILLIIAMAILIFIPALENRRLLNIAIIALMYVTLGESWNLLSGMSGLFSINHALFFGLGTYGVTFGLNKLGFSVLGSILLGLAMNLVAATIVGYIGTKLSGLYFTMAFIGLWQTVYTFSYQFFSITGGSLGLSMPRELLLSKRTLYFIALIMAIASMIFYQFIRRSRLGTNFVALKENPDLANALGSNIRGYRFLSTIISACMASFAGSFYAFYMMTNNPEVFSGIISLKIIMVVIVGGMGHVFGPLLGISFVIMDELIRGMMPSQFAPFSVIIYGFALIIMAMVKPEGLISIFKKKPKDNGVAAKQSKKATA
ncbi:branched-chain amino acid ABC transporter permease [Anaerobium acetethylicum]|uniref:Branched-chain amino acid transport system permease protein n=1 Tax=Anaerobium acetethylicum TaxID=1619234 RepID=A0A1D3TV23_9FIRM|nr:branched-chain amino acid ABC transporter permease [Anaerobium acetethylicum]SCP97982.1 branched-chain amino acid transport system permease protein [Anaerobium acetethylicum]